MLKKVFRLDVIITGLVIIAGMTAVLWPQYTNVQYYQDSHETIVINTNQSILHPKRVWYAQFYNKDKRLVKQAFYEDANLIPHYKKSLKFIKTYSNVHIFKPKLGAKLDVNTTQEIPN